MDKQANWDQLLVFDIEIIVYGGLFDFLGELWDEWGLDMEEILSLISER